MVRVWEGLFKKPEKSFEKIRIRLDTSLWYFVKREHKIFNLPGRALVKFAHILLPDQGVA